ncbi:MAG: response regulator transcription factor [Nitrolancea sp.]
MDHAFPHLKGRQQQSGWNMRIVVVDSDSLTGKLIEFALIEAGERVVVCIEPIDAINQATGNGTDVVLVNIDFDGARGPGFCRFLRSRSYRGPLLMWGERRREDLLQAYDFGIDDFIVEPFDPREAIARIRAVSRRFERFDNQRLGQIRVGSAELSVGRLSFRVANGPEIQLSPIETRILEILMRNREVVLSPETLLRAVWDSDHEAGTNRVQVYMMRLRRKIEPDPDNPVFIHTIRGLGYVFRISSESPAPPPEPHPHIIGSPLTF